MILALCLTSSGFSLKIDLDQQDNIASFYLQESGNSIVRNVVGSESNKSVNSFIIDNTTYRYDINFEFSSITEDFYLILQNYVVNSTITIMYRGDLNLNPTLYVQDLVLNEQGRYYFKFSPDNVGEAGRVFIEFPTTYVSTIEYIETKPEGFNSLIGGFVGGFIEIVNINVNLWRVAFYGVILIIMLSFVALLFGGSWYIFKMSKRVKDDKGFFGGQR